MSFGWKWGWRSKKGKDEKEDEDEDKTRMSMRIKGRMRMRWEAGWEGESTWVRETGRGRVKILMSRDKVRTSKMRINLDKDED